MGLDIPRMMGTDGLSPREQEVLRLMAGGASRKEISAKLGIAVKTVEFHRSSAARKLTLKSRSDVVSYAIDRG
jgi:two-component system response regulator NreC